VAAHIGQNAFGGFEDDGDDAARLAAFVDDRGIVEVHPDLLGPARAMQRQLLILVGERAPGQADFHDIVVEFGDLRPALAHVAAKQMRVARAGEDRIGVVVES
jgi:hypothetical protein